MQITHVPVGGDQTGTGSTTSRDLLELGIGSSTKSHTLIPITRRVSVRSSRDCSAWLVSYEISVTVGEVDRGNGRSIARGMN